MGKNKEQEDGGHFSRQSGQSNVIQRSLVHPISGLLTQLVPVQHAGLM